MNVRRSGVSGGLCQPLTDWKPPQFSISHLRRGLRERNSSSARTSFYPSLSRKCWCRKIGIWIRISICFLSDHYVDIEACIYGHLESLFSIPRTVIHHMALGITEFL